MSINEQIKAIQTGGILQESSNVGMTHSSETHKNAAERVKAEAERYAKKSNRLSSMTESEQLAWDAEQEVLQETSLFEHHITTMVDAALRHQSLNESSTLETKGIGQLMIEAVEAAENGESNKLAAAAQVIKDKFQKLKAAFDPLDGLRELKLIEQYVADYNMANKQTFLWGFIGAYRAITALAKQYGEMDEHTIKMYVDEATKFRQTLLNKAKQAEASSDPATVKTAKKFRKQAKRLDNMIAGFKHHADAYREIYRKKQEKLAKKAAKKNRKNG